MSHDFRRGSPKQYTINPATYLAGGMASMVWAPRINLSGTDVADPYDTGVPAGRGPTYWPLRVPGLGDVRRVPAAICALLYGRTFDFEVSFSAVGLSQTWSGTVTRGKTTWIDDGGTEVTGVELATIRDTWSLRGSPLAPAEGQSRWISDLNPGDNAEEFALTLGDTDGWNIWYFAALDEWVVHNDFIRVSASLYNGGTDEFGNTGSTVHDSEPELTGLTFCGFPWSLGGVNVTSLSGSIDVVTWLDP